LDKKDLKHLQKEIEEALKEFSAPGVAVGIIKDGKILLSQGFGYRNYEKKLPVTDKTIFAIASCTKAFTAFLLGQLVDEGCLSFDDKVVKHIPDFRLYDDYISSHITIRDLLSHTSGLPRHDAIWYSNPHISRKTLLQRLSYLEPARDFRQKCQYNNLMYMVAGSVIEAVTGQEWEIALKNRIFKPLGMNFSNSCVIDSQNSDDFALPYLIRERSPFRIPFRDISLVGPGASINSSIADLLKWIQVHLSKGLFLEKKQIERATLEEIHTLQAALPAFPTEPIYSLGFGLGWEVGVYRGHYWLTHEGRVDGFSSSISLFPKEAIGLIILTNSSPTSHSPLTIHIQDIIADRLLGLKKEKKSKEKKPFSFSQEKRSANKPPLKPPSLQPYLGSYEHPGYGNLEIQEKEGRLFGKLNKITFPLTYQSVDLFCGAPTEAIFDDETMLTFSFSRGFEGEVSGLSVPFEPFVEPICFKKKPRAERESLPYLTSLQGIYENSFLTIEIILRGEHLVALVTGDIAFGQGQPAYTLTAEGELSFSLREFPGGFFQFKKENDMVTELLFRQPFEKSILKKRLDIL
jgi:CubicO group peptidase (beta-lactamase class C family)